MSLTALLMPSYGVAAQLSAYARISLYVSPCRSRLAGQFQPLLTAPPPSPNTQRKGTGCPSALLAVLPCHGSSTAAQLRHTHGPPMF
ncbi:hypothetical protein BX600DRAFT_459162 [Xylariales sp. PMI_506]|nr:hypothetical protein BX600DRAFT_459162 [Xylariales sp. PMI_506]